MGKLLEIFKTTPGGILGKSFVEIIMFLGRIAAGMAENILLNSLLECQVICLIKIATILEYISKGIISENVKGISRR